MNEEKARAVLKDYIQQDGGLFCLGHYMAWNKGNRSVTLDSIFSAEELEAIAWWMKNNS